MPRSGSLICYSLLALGLGGACTVTVEPVKLRPDGGDATGQGGTGGSSSRCTGYVAIDGGLSGGLSQGLVAYYPCEQASGTSLPDQSGNGRNATLASSGTGGSSGYRFAAGKVGKALYLNSASEGHAVLPSGLLANACEASIATWIYLNSESPWQRAWTFSTGGSVYMYLTTSNEATGNLRYGITLNANIGDDQQFVDGPMALPKGVWKHVVVVLGPSRLVLYVDGAQVAASTSVTLRPADLGKTLYDYIGRSNYTWDPYLDGNVDELRVYNRALSPAEVQELFTQT